MGNTISFPNLGIYLGTIKPTAFYISGHPIMWYGIIIAVGFLLGTMYSSKKAPRFGISPDSLLDMLIIAAPVSIIFARLYYVIFNFEAYSSDLLKIFRVWEGGIAIYGAIIGGLVVLVVFCKIKSIRTFDMLDTCSLGLMIGQFIGRWGNFVNAEAYGSETFLPWAMSINNMPGVHPTFLYESLWNFTGFIALHFYSKHRKFSGEIFWLYVCWYGLGRFLIEGLRSDSLYIWGTNLRISQCIALISLILGLIVLIYKYLTLKKLQKTKLN